MDGWMDERAEQRGEERGGGFIYVIISSNRMKSSRIKPHQIQSEHSHQSNLNPHTAKKKKNRSRPDQTRPDRPDHASEKLNSMKLS